MADLNLLFEETGLEAVIPYAFDRDSPGYKFLCDKLIGGVTFFVLVSNVTDLPCYFTTDDKVYFALYTNEEAAMAQCDLIAAAKSYATPVELDTEGWARDLWVRYRDLGISHIRMNDAVWVSIRDLAPPLPYDGLINVQAPLKNAALNAALNAFMQAFNADDCPDSVTSYFYELLKESTLYVPVRLTRPLRPGEVVNESNSEFWTEDIDDESKALLLFTDDPSKQIYCNAADIPLDDMKIVYAPTWNNIMTYVKDHKLDMLINGGSSNLYLTLDGVAELEMTDLNFRAAN